MSTLVFDGDCAFCTTCVGLLARLRLRAGTVIAWQHADLAALGLTEAQCQERVQWVSDDGIASGHAAVAHLMLASGLGWRLVGRLLLVPGLSWVAARAYDWVAAHRHQLPGGTPACQVMGDSSGPPQT